MKIILMPMTALLDPADRNDNSTVQTNGKGCTPGSVPKQRTQSFLTALFQTCLAAGWTVIQRGASSDRSKALETELQSSE